MPAPKYESPGVASAQGLQETTDTAIVTETTPTRKEVANLQVDYAFVGHELIPGPNGDFTAARWGLTRYLQDWAAAVEFAKKIGARK